MGEKSTHVRSIQGWEDRIATMIPFFSMTGKLVSPLVLIFKGKGKKVAVDELAEYKKLKNILVLWQPKAWIDKTLEKEVMKHQVIPEVKARKKEYEDRGEVFPGFLLLQDRGPGHDDQCVVLSSPIPSHQPTSSLGMSLSYARRQVWKWSSPHPTRLGRSSSSTMVAASRFAT